MAVARKTFVDVWSAGVERCRKGPLPPLLVVAGEEAFVKERLIQAAVESHQGDVETFAAAPGERDANALRRLLDLWGTSTLFGGGQLIVARGVDGLLKKQGLKQLEERLSGGTPPNHLLVTVQALDGRSKLAKAVKAHDGLVSLPVLRDAPPPWHTGGPFLETDLNQWIVAEAAHEGLTVPLPVAAELARRIGIEPGRIVQKLDQLRVLHPDRTTIRHDDVEQFVPFSSTRLLGLYEDALVGGELAEALSLMDRMIHEGVQDPFQRLVTGPAVAETVLRGLTANLARLYDAHERLGPQLVKALDAKPWERSKTASAALDDALGRGGRRVFLERDLKRVSHLASARAFDVALTALRRLRDGRGLSMHAQTVRLLHAYQAAS